jgi:hypothetical protein
MGSPPGFEFLLQAQELEKYLWGVLSGSFLIFTQLRQHRKVFQCAGIAERLVA